MGIKGKDVKLLWGRAAGHCSFPGCPNEIISSSANEVAGEICHIVAREPGGPRGNPNLSDDELNSYDNLILLCPYHHSIVDNDENEYTVETLKTMKVKHETEVRRKWQTGEPWKPDLALVDYVNIPRLSMLATQYGEDLDTSFLADVPDLHSLAFELGRILWQYGRVLKRLELRAVPLDSLTLTDTSALGLIVCFEEHFRTRNVPWVPRRGQRVQRSRLSGDLSKVAQIYTQRGEFKVVLPIDSRWITTDSAYVDFSPPGGHAYFRGLCIIKTIDVTSRVVVATPIIIGIPAPFGSSIGPSMW